MNCCWNSSDISDMSDSEFQVNFCCYPEVVAAVADVVNVVSVFFGKSCFLSSIVCVRALGLHHTPHASTWQPNVLPLEKDPHPHPPPSSFW